MSDTLRNDARKLRSLDFDLANYFSNTIIPQLFVDADLILRIFTPPAMDQFSLSHADINRSIVEVKDNIRYPTIVENIREVIDSGKVLEKEVQTTDRRWFQMNMVPYVEHETGSNNGVIITFVDITKRVESMKELEKLNSEHNVLMFALSHDIRQPVSTITLLGDALKLAFEKQDSGQFNNYIKSLKRSAKSLKSLTDDYTRKTEGAENEEQNISIVDVCDDVLVSLKEEIRRNEVQVDQELDVSEMKFPRNNLRSIVYNLIHNAIKFRHPERPLEIKITTKEVRDFVILCVEDNGRGIAEEDQRKVFKKFSRVDENIRGTGMGLYIIKNMIENKKGRIKMESTPGKGTLFSIYFRNKKPAN